ncbi:MAG TPA: hypothetical protein VL306_03105 [Methylomirabilota bacterium]|nr:hypothetical protein [Methylomirabilota bacterium]
MILSIDVSDPKIVKLNLLAQHKIFSHFFECEKNLSEKLALEIEKFLKKEKFKFNSLKKIEVASSHGHFSRIRTAVSTANALNFGLGLKQKLILPSYDKAPNITMAK